MTAPLTLIVEGKPLVFDVRVPVGEVIPAGTWSAYDFGEGLDLHRPMDESWSTSIDGYLLPRPPVAPESFADGDVACLTLRREDAYWTDDTNSVALNDGDLTRMSRGGTAFFISAPRPESLADVLDDANLPDELRARIEKAVGA